MDESPAISKRYAVIYADPPWRYEVYSRDTGLGRSAESHYSTMPTADIAKLPIADLAAPDCALFMWATWPAILDAFALGAAWGFTYKTCGFLWAKMNKNAANRWTNADDPANWFTGMGFHTRSNTEPCLLFTRGKPKRKSKAVRQFIASPIQAHSQKPDGIYNRIESLLDGPYLELFARRKWLGWDSWGNEIDSDVQMATEATNKEIDNYG